MRNYMAATRAFWRKNWWFGLLIAVETVFVGAQFAHNYSYAQPVTLSAAQFSPSDSAATVEEEGLVYPCSEENAGTLVQFATTFPFTLRAGSYRFVVDYVAEDCTPYIQFESNGSTNILGLQYDPIQLRAGQTQAIGSLLLSEDRGEGDELYLCFSIVCYVGDTVQLSGVQLLPTHALAYSHLITTVLLLALLNWALLVVLRRLPFPLRSIKSRYTAVFLLAILLFACMPLGLDWLLNGHDLSVHLTRIELLVQTLQQGQFPARLYPNAAFGKGYPFGIMYPDLLLYPAALLRLVGFPLSTCYNCYLVAITVATALVTLFCLRRIFGSETIALTGTALYLLCPYRLTNVFVRSAVGEYTAMLFLPLVVYGLWAIYTQPRDTKKASPWCWLPLALAFSGLLQSHLLSTLLAGFFTALFALLMLRRTFAKPVFPALCKAVGATVAWNLWYLVPFLQYLLSKSCAISMTASNPRAFRDHATFPAQLFALTGDVPGMSASLHDGLSLEMPLTIGLVLGLGSMLLLAALLDPQPSQKSSSPRHVLGAFSLGFGLLAAWMSCTLFPWAALFRFLPHVAALFEVIQFPWRFLAPASLFFVLATCCALALLPARLAARLEQANQLSTTLLRLGLAGLLLVMSILPASRLLYDICKGSHARNYLSTAALQERPAQVNGAEYIPAAFTLPHYDEYGDWIDPTKLYNEVWTVTTPVWPEGVTPENFTTGTLTNTFTARNDGEGERTVQLPLFDYPGYQLTGDTGAMLTQADGFVGVILPASWSGTVTVRWHCAWYWHLADLFSLLCISGTAVLFLRRKRTESMPQVPASAL